MDILALCSAECHVTFYSRLTVVNVRKTCVFDELTKINICIFSLARAACVGVGA